MLDKNGEKTEQYEKLKRVNSSIKALASVYMNYRWADTLNLEHDSAAANWGYIRDLQVGEGATLLAGLLRKDAREDETALFLTAGQDKAVLLRFRADSPAIFRTGEMTLRLIPDEDGCCTLEIPPCRGGLLTCEEQ